MILIAFFIGALFGCLVGLGVMGLLWFAIGSGEGRPLEPASSEAGP